MSKNVQALWRYPVKGLSPEPMTSVSLEAGKPLQGDRRFAVTLGSAQIDPAHPEWRPKRHFVQLVNHPRLAALTTRWIDSADTLTVERDGRVVAQAALTTPLGRSRLIDFLVAYLKDATLGIPRVVEAKDFAYSDVDGPFVSIINAASLDDLARVAGVPLDPRRFRANVMITGAEAWEELSWVGKTIRLGSAVLQVEQRIARCKATNANPDNGTEDLSIPRFLRAGFGHIEFGAYARVIEGGTAGIGEPLIILP